MRNFATILFLMLSFAAVSVHAAIKPPILGEETSSLGGGNPTTAPAQVNDLNFVSDLAIFPNPTTGYFDINFTYTGSQNISVRVFSIIGKEIMNEQANGGAYSHRVELRDYPKGIYIVEITNGTQKMTKRVSYI